jgi:hypothetical protein
MANAVNCRATNSGPRPPEVSPARPLPARSAKIFNSDRTVGACLICQAKPVLLLGDNNLMMRANVMSALPPKADMCGARADVC